MQVEPSFPKTSAAKPTSLAEPARGAGFGRWERMSRNFYKILSEWAQSCLDGNGHRLLSNFPMLESGKFHFACVLMTEFEIDELRRAYQLLDVPYWASDRSIKRAYRRITKRWHPDRYTSGTPTYTEATQMMKLINEAYSQIANAPLRYYDEQTAAAPRTQKGSEAYRSANSEADKSYVHNPGNPYSNGPYVTDVGMRPERLGRRFGAFFRFLVGGVFGVYALWLFYVFVRLDGHPALAIVLILGAFLSGGFAMLHYGQNLRWGRW